MSAIVHTVFASLSAVSPGSLPTTNADQATINNIVNIVFGIAGALALLMITISGLRYIVSNGDPQRASKARNGIIFALVGLAVAIAARAIVVFIVDGIS